MSSENNAKEKYGISDELAEFIESKNPTFWTKLLKDEYDGDPIGELTAYKALYIIEKGLISADELIEIVNKAIAK